MTLNFNELESTVIYVVKVHSTGESDGSWQNMKSFIDEDLAMLYAAHLKEIDRWKLVHTDTIGLYKYCIDIKPLDEPK